MVSKKDVKSSISEYRSSIFNEDSEISPRSVNVSIVCQNDFELPDDFLIFVILFNGHTILEMRWENKSYHEIKTLPLNLKEFDSQTSVADKPLIFLLRGTGTKGTKDLDPLLNPENRAGGCLDLFPLVLGEEKIFTKIRLNSISTGEYTGRVVNVIAKSCGYSDIDTIPFMMTMVSAHCLPVAKEGTAYITAVGFDGLVDPMGVSFGLSLSSNTATKVLWASASSGGKIANTEYNIPNEDVFVPRDLCPKVTVNCNSVYWNAMKRVLVNPASLRQRLSKPFLVEVGGVPRTGKVEIRGRYMGFVDANVLLEPGQNSVTTSTKLLFYNEANLPNNFRPLLELPPSSAKISARETDVVLDEFGHNPYIIIKFDLIDSLVPKAKIAVLYETLGFRPPRGPLAPIDVLYVEPQEEYTKVDVRSIRRECGALAVHKELSALACRGTVPMNQSIKRTAANRLLMRVRTMLKEFPPGHSSYVEWQDTVTYQHAASRKAVTSSFAPQPPPLRPSSLMAATRCNIAGDYRIAKIHTESNLEIAPFHPRSLMSKVLRCLEERNDSIARTYLLKALNFQTSNRYLLWILGGQEFDKTLESKRMETASAAFRIAAKGDISDGTTNAISWAALHAFHHHNGNIHAAFVAAKKMRKSYELQKEWGIFLQRWTDISGEEQVFWIPEVIISENPMLIAAAFFLCLRCYHFSESLLKCVEGNCATVGSRLRLKTKITPDIYYLRSASLLLRRKYDEALEITKNGVKRFGPTAILSQMLVSCLCCIRGWDGECESALKCMEQFGAKVCPALLLKASSGLIVTNPHIALQRAARAHKIAPSAHSALLIGRIYITLKDSNLAERWASAAVKIEPLLADGWAVLALLAIFETDIDKARVMFRTAKQAGPINPDIEIELEKWMDKIQVETLPECLIKKLCFCGYY